MALTYKEFLEVYKRDEEERKKNRFNPSLRDWTEEFGDEVERHPLGGHLCPRGCR